MCFQQADPAPFCEVRVGEEILKCIEKVPVRLECTLDLSTLYKTNKDLSEFKKRYKKFVKGGECNSEVYRLEGDTLIYQSEQLVPSKENGKPSLLLVFGNPASHSVVAGCFFAFKDGRENRFWKNLLGNAGVIDLCPQEGLSNMQQNRMRSEQLRSLKYKSPFRIGLCVYFTMPSSAGGKHAGVAGIRKLLRSEAWRKVMEEEKARVLRFARNFVKGNGIAVTFQKDAWEGLRSPDDPPYTIANAREGRLRGSLNDLKAIPLLGVPPTRLLGPCREILRRILAEWGYPLLPGV